MAQLSADLAAALDRAAAAERLLACWDFDGTLAPIVPNPEAARPLPGAVAELERLAAISGTEVALLSGRARADLGWLSGAGDPIVLVGSHGAELPDGLGEGRDDAQPGALDEVVASVEQIVAGADGVLLEVKPVSVAVHVRNVADRELAGRICARVLAGPGAAPGVHVTTGKEVVELSVRRVDKGAAIEALRRRHGATATVFVGDDVTDERGFAVLGAHDVGVKVGDGATAARYRVEDPEAVLEVLRRLVAARSAG